MRRPCHRATPRSRSHATTGAYASAPSAVYDRADAVIAPRCAAQCRNSSTRRVLPMPGSPVTTTRCAAAGAGLAPQFGQPPSLRAGARRTRSRRSFSARRRPAAAAVPRTAPASPATAARRVRPPGWPRTRGRPGPPAPGRPARRAAASAPGTAPRRDGRAPAPVPRTAGRCRSRRLPRVAAPAGPAPRSPGGGTGRARRPPTRRNSLPAAHPRRGRPPPRRSSSLVERRVEGDDVGRELAQRQRLPRGVQMPVGAGDRGAQRVQDVPQVGAGLLVGRVGPEQERDPVAPLRRTLAERARYASSDCARDDVSATGVPSERTSNAPNRRTSSMTVILARPHPPGPSCYRQPRGACARWTSRCPDLGV